MSEIKIISNEKLLLLRSEYHDNFYEKIIVVGMGASVSNTKALESIFSSKKEIIYIDNLEEKIIDAKIKDLTAKNTVIVAISKSGETEETIILLQYLLSCPNLKNTMCYCVVNNKKNSNLEKIANLHSKNVSMVEYEDSISGRFSVLQNASFFPLILAGSEIFKIDLDLDAVKKEAKNLSNSIISYIEEKKNIVVISVYDIRILGFAEWLRQILAESLGKENFGITPIISIGSSDEHSQLQLYLEGPSDKIFYLLPFNKPEINLLTTSQKKHHKYFEQTLVDLKKHFIKEDSVNISTIARWMFAIEYIAKEKGINPFNQPSVDRAKKVL